jgi:predicted RNase H-like HicB family nuclease
MEVRYTAVFQQIGDWWMAFAEELPGANTQGRSLAEARENLKEAIRLILESNRQLAEERIAGQEVQREELLVSVG